MRIYCQSNFSYVSKKSVTYEYSYRVIMIFKLALSVNYFHRLIRRASLNNDKLIRRAGSIFLNIPSIYRESLATTDGTRKHIVHRCKTDDLPKVSAFTPRCGCCHTYVYDLYPSIYNTFS